MLRRLSLAAAVAAATGVAWAAQPTPLPTKTDLISVYKEAVDNNAEMCIRDRLHFVAAGQAMGEPLAEEQVELVDVYKRQGYTARYLYFRRPSPL